MLYDYDYFDLQWLKGIVNLPLGSAVRLSSSKTGLHLKTKAHNTLLFANSCKGFQHYATALGAVLWKTKEGKSSSEWVVVTARLKQLLISSRNPAVAMSQYLTSKD